MDLPENSCYEVKIYNGIICVEFYLDINKYICISDLFALKFLGGRFYATYGLMVPFVTLKNQSCLISAKFSEQCVIEIYNKHTSAQIIWGLNNHTDRYTDGHR